MASVCPKCGGRLQGESCYRHGPLKAPPTRALRALRVLQEEADRQAKAPDGPWSDETARRIWSMQRRLCPECRHHCCSSYELCPLMRAKWLGDWSGEYAAPGKDHTEEILEMVPPSTGSITSTSSTWTQQSLF